MAPFLLVTKSSPPSGCSGKSTDSDHEAPAQVPKKSRRRPRRRGKRKKNPTARNSDGEEMVRKNVHLYEDTNAKHTCEKP